MTTDEVIRILIFVVAAFLPPVLYMIGIRNTERYGKEPWFPLIKTFIWGAVIAVFIAIILSVILIVIYQTGLESIPSISFLGDNPTFELIILSVVIAPFTEEFAKGLGVYSVRDQISEEEDGLVYGAVCGLGFSATENLLYGFVAYVVGGWSSFFALIIIRSIASTLLHASASSMMGYGVAKSLMWKEKASALPYYLAAVGMHASYNLLASMGIIYETTYGTDAPYTFSIHLFSLLIVIFFALVAAGLMRRKIRSLESGRIGAYQQLKT